MQRNPAYYFLKDHRELFKGKRTDKKSNPYILIDLATVAPGVNTDLKINGEAEHLVKHHLTIYKEFEEKQSSEGLSSFHYTAEYQQVMVHAYFNWHGQYLYSIVKNKASGERITLEREEEQQIRRLSEAQLGEPLNVILQALTQEQETLRTQVTAALTQLEAKSKELGVFNQAYLDLLIQTIQAIDQHHERMFVVDSSVKNFLERQRVSIASALEEKARPQAAPPTSAPTILPIIPATQAVAPAVPAIPVVSIKSLKAEFKAAKALPVDQRFATQKACLKQLWNHCPAEDIYFAIYLDKQEEEIKGERQRALLRACRNNEEALVKALLCEEDDQFVMPMLCQSACVRNYQSIFAYLYPRTQLKSLVSGRVAFFLSSEELATEAGLNAFFFERATPLDFAYYHKNFEFFSELLDKDQVDADLCIDATGEPLLVSCVRNRDFKYVEKLLASGANTNITVVKTAPQDPFQMEFDKKKAGDDLSQNTQMLLDKKRQILSENSRVPGVTALYLAARDRNHALVHLLLSYGASTSLTAIDNFNAFGTAGPCNREEPMSIELFEKIRAAGRHHIDEQHGITNGGSTALWWACQYDETESVAYLLSQGADPFKRTKTAGGLELTPLSRATFGRNIATVRVIVDFLNSSPDLKIKSSEIQRALEWPEKDVVPENKEINEAIKALLQPLYCRAALTECKSYDQDKKYYMEALLYHSIFTKKPTACDPATLRAVGRNLEDEAKSKGPGQLQLVSPLVKTLFEDADALQIEEEVRRENIVPVYWV